MSAGREKEQVTTKRLRRDTFNMSKVERNIRTMLL